MLTDEELRDLARKIAPNKGRINISALRDAIQDVEFEVLSNLARLYAQDKSLAVEFLRNRAQLLMMREVANSERHR